MIIDSNSSDVSTELVSDVVIVGAGTVGLFLADCLVSSGLDVILVESGGTAIGRVEDKISVGRPHKGSTVGRASGVGGTSRLWGGQLAEFESDDLVRPDRFWPITYDQLQEGYAETYRRLNMPLRRDAAHIMSRLGLGENESEELEFFYTHWLREPNFAISFKYVIEKRATILTNATVNAFKFSDRRADFIIARTSSGKEIAVHGKAVVLASGCIDTVQLLLTSQQIDGIPWRYNKNVGAYFQDHLAGRVGTLLVESERLFRNLFENVFIDGTKIQPKLRPGPVLRAELDYGVCGNFVFKSKIDENLAHLKRLVRNARQNLNGSTARTLVRDTGTLGRRMSSIVLRYVKDNRVMAFWDQGLEFHLHAEQRPIWDSRIALSGFGYDRRGLLPIVLDWRVDGAEIEGIRKFAHACHKWFLRKGIGTLTLDSDLDGNGLEFLDRLTDTYHHAGGACMGSSPSLGVTRQDCSIWGTDNVYVAGAAVFPSSSYANTTLTALSLATRLSKLIVNEYSR